jgi:hypothetical protein
MAEQPASVIMTAIIAIAALEVCAMYMGYDGTILAGALALIGGLGGYLTGHTVCAIRIRKALDRRETPR